MNQDYVVKQEVCNICRTARRERTRNGVAGSIVRHNRNPEISR